MTITEHFLKVRTTTEKICKPLQVEDYVVQPIIDVSPPKWHLGHTTWFFETFILKNFVKNYQVYNADYNYVFNSYYETIGARVIRTDRGNLSRPSVQDVYKYRKYVDEKMVAFLKTANLSEIQELMVLGLNHEEQHQELLLTDIKYILGNNPLFPTYGDRNVAKQSASKSKDFIQIEEGVYEIGFKGDGFCFDNELNRHKVYLNAFSISPTLVSNAGYLAFIESGGYKDFSFWHADGWEWVNTNNASAPMYWHSIDGQWYNYTYSGLQALDLNAALCHVNYYEAYAYASWKGMRLPTEFEWEIAAQQFDWGSRWEWTESAYLPYPGFNKAPGAIGEYNGKFMVNQKVLRGGSEVTSENHSRITYRNFFHPDLKWQFTGIRLAK
ncbi:ergothioneine biosynthesis protein EgtB [Pedobacter sp. UYP30]|uniref:ergothioneine biosynthesis protein EgtB n=1 Tax=Pedobacter sp. UYP30 TaxID=1756400 RepID=UPI003392269C